MSASTIFTIIIILILLRVFRLKAKAAGTRTESFKQLPDKDQLAVLKECLLNNPTETNLQNLIQFCQKICQDLDAESYRVFMKRQLELSKMKNALAEDNELFSLEAEWMDKISPLEFKAAEAALAQGNNVDFVKDSLEGIARLYSDQAIRFHLEQLNPYYSKAENLLKDYERLVELRENSGADDKSLEILRKTKDAWENDLLNIEMNSQE